MSILFQNEMLDGSKNGVQYYHWEMDEFCSENSLFSACNRGYL